MWRGKLAHALSFPLGELLAFVRCKASSSAHGPRPARRALAPLRHTVAQAWDIVAATQSQRNLTARSGAVAVDPASARSPHGIATLSHWQKLTDATCTLAWGHRASGEGVARGGAGGTCGGCVSPPSIELKLQGVVKQCCVRRRSIHGLGV